MIRSWLFLLLLLAASCATHRSAPDPATCRSRADEAYRNCINPLYVPRGEPLEAVRGDEAQGCQQAHRQALAECEPPPEVPLPEVRTSSSSL